MSPEVAAPGCAIRADLARAVTFASHRCDVPAILDLVPCSPFGNDPENLTLHLSAEPKVPGDRTWTVDRLAAASELRLTDRRVALAGGMLDALTGRMRAEVRLELRQGDRVLAAFVMPNDPAVLRVLKRASPVGALGQGG